MKNIKKIALLPVLAATVFGLASCGGTSSSSDAPKPSEPASSVASVSSQPATATSTAAPASSEPKEDANAFETMDGDDFLETNLTSWLEKDVSYQFITDEGKGYVLADYDIEEHAMVNLCADGSLFMATRQRITCSSFYYVGSWEAKETKEGNDTYTDLKLHVRFMINDDWDETALHDYKYSLADDGSGSYKLKNLDIALAYHVYFRQIEQCTGKKVTRQDPATTFADWTKAIDNPKVSNYWVGDVKDATNGGKIYVIALTSGQVKCTYYFLNGETPVRMSCNTTATVTRVSPEDPKISSIAFDFSNPESAGTTYTITKGDGSAATFTFTAKEYGSFDDIGALKMHINAGGREMDAESLDVAFHKGPVDIDAKCNPITAA